MTTAGRRLAPIVQRVFEAARSFAADRSGATAIEYGLIVALIFIAILGAVNNFVGATSDMYSDISSALD